MARRRRSGVTRQALAAADLQFSPQAFALSQLLQQARDDYLTGVRVEKGAARGVKASVKASIPQVDRYFDQAQDTRVSAQRVVDQKLGGLSSAADDIKAASARENAGARTRLAESRSNALTELRDRLSQADSAAAFAISSNRSRYLSDKDKLNRQALELSRQQGVFTTAEVGRLTEAKRKERSSAKAEARQQRALDAQLTGVDPKTGQPTYQAQKDATTRADKKSAAKKKKGAKETQGSKKIYGQVVTTRAAYERGLAKKWPRTRIAKEARKQGVPEYVLVAAADLANFGYVTPGHLRAIKRAGLERIPKEWRTPRRRSTTQIANQAAQTGIFR